MQQHTFTLWQLDKVHEVIARVREILRTYPATQIVCRVQLTFMWQEAANFLNAELKRAFPQALVVCLSQSMLWIPRDAEHTCAKLSFMLLRGSRVVPILAGPFGDPDCDGEAVGRQLGERLDELPDLVCAEVLPPAELFNQTGALLKSLSAGRGDLLLYGAGIGTGHYHREDYGYENGDRDLQVLVEPHDWPQFTDAAGNAVATRSGPRELLMIDGQLRVAEVLVLAFCGPQLKVHAEFTLGWTPVGREFEITRMTGRGRVVSIDGKAAVEIYRKYLNVEPRADFTFHILEFPLTVKRGDLVLARLPIVCYPDGSIYFSMDVHEHEKVRFAYGRAEDLLAHSRRCAQQLSGFMPQGMQLVICANRMLFLKDLFNEEVEYFSGVLPQANIYFGSSEIYCHHGQGGHLGSTLVAVGFREEDDDLTCLPTACHLVHKFEHPGVPQLAERLAFLLRAVTDDLEHSNQELEAAAEQARQASRAKSQFLSNMSHEIRTPINAILGMNEMILRESSQPEIIGYAQAVRSAGDQLLSIVNDVLDFSRIEAGKLTIINVEYEVSSMLNDLLALLQTRAEAKGLELRVEVDPELPSVLGGDEIRVKQVLTNLLTNAIKYTERGSVTFRLGCLEKGGAPGAGDRAGVKGGAKEVRGETKGEAKGAAKGEVKGEIVLQAVIADTGIGIRAEDLPKLCVEFERLDERRNRTVEGTGMGMAIVHRLLKMMHGTMAVRSEYGRGSEFTVNLPQQVINARPIGPYSGGWRTVLSQDRIYHAAFRAPQAAVLAVDDTAVNLTVIKGLLKQTGIEVDTAESGYDCLNRCEKRHYDVILLDHRMPGMDGIETLHRLRENPGLNAGVPVVALTANAMAGARDEYLKEGFDAYLTKPVDSAMLENLLLELLPESKVSRVEQEEMPDTAEEVALPDFLKELPYLDTALGLRNCGTTDLYLDALKVFAQSGVAGADELERYAAKGELESYTIKVHALKSSARIIGAVELSNRALRLEEAGKGGYRHEIEQTTPALLELYRRITAALSPLLKDEKAQGAAAAGEAEDTRPLMSEADLSAALDGLNEAVAGFDFDSLQLLIQTLGDYRLPPGREELVRALIKAAGVPDWDKLRELLKPQA